ncbi:glycosyltransferase [Fictibacillus nanhaiensis]|uniref:glycosyltransferase n=1 Tax=Fictibacillus nanhaiensis TaxID=742169 RepID=UPI001C97C3BC|nr:glycosyltransferase [Fictibacillus nanhaiensis]MBY6037185.1 glycosyltransferase [Fictibacillus nanhaiensis]
MNIVVMTGSYHPKYSANSRCLGNIVEELENNHHITVISNDPSENNSRGQYRNHEIVRVSTLRQKKRKKIEKKINSSTGIKKTFWKQLLTFNKVIHVSKTLVSRYTVEYELVEEYLQALNSIEDEIDVIIPACNPIESILAAQKYNSSKLDTIKIIPFLFDKYSTSKTAHWFDFNRSLKMKNHLQLEKRMIEQSKAILTYFSWADHIKKHFAQFEKKITYVEHPLIKEIDDITENNVIAQSGEISIVYAGGLSRKIRHPQYTLDLLKEIIDVNQSVMLHLFITGDCNQIVNEQIKGFSANIVNHGTVTSKEAINAMKGASYLLLIGNHDISQMQSKVYEYMSCGRPIILLYKHSEDPIIKVLEKYPYVCMLKQDKQLIESNKKTLLSFIESNCTSYINFNDIKKIYYDSTPEYIANKLIKVINENNGGETQIDNTYHASV